MSAEEFKNWSGKAKPGITLWNGPKDIRDEFISSYGVDFTASYIDPSNWIEQTRTIVPYTFYGRDMLRQRALRFCTEQRITISDRRVLDG